jgi:predicted acylesterase/phospholipase RssA
MNDLNQEIQNPIEIHGEQHNIKHLVISGGGAFFYKAYGILKSSSLKKCWDFKNLKTIYGTSCGAILSYIIALNFDWEILDNFLINRPWDKIFDINMNTMFNSIQNCGILGVSTIEQTFEPLLKAKNMNLNITLNEFYENTGIEIHSFATNLNNFELIDISYKTHSDWKVIETIYASCCLPVLFSPYEKENNIYLDGGIFCNYPLKYCICQTNCSPNEIFGINSVVKTTSLGFSIENSSLFEYILYILILMLVTIRIKYTNNEMTIPLEIKVIDNMKNSPLYSIYQCTLFIDIRTKMISSGEEIFENYFNENRSLLQPYITEI